MTESFLKPGVRPDPVPEQMPYIPRRIWQTTRDRNNVRADFMACVENLKAMNPTWDHQLFDDATQQVFLERVCSDRFMRAYARIAPEFGAARADLFRYVVTYLHGGAYLDLKSGTTRPLDDILLPDDRYILSQWDNGPDGLFPGVGTRKTLKEVPGGEYEQWFVITTPGHPYLAAVIERALTNIENYSPIRFGHGARGVLNMCGPNNYTRAIRAIEKQHPHRWICAWHEGLRYSMFEGGIHAHQTTDKAHYSRYLKAPITTVGLTGPQKLAYWLREAIYAPVTWLRRWNYARLDRHYARKAAR